MYEDEPTNISRIIFSLTNNNDLQSTITTVISDKTQQILKSVPWTSIDRINYALKLTEDSIEESIELLIANPELKIPIESSIPINETESLVKDESIPVVNHHKSSARDKREPKIKKNKIDKININETKEIKEKVLSKKEKRKADRNKDSISIQIEKEESIQSIGILI